MSISLSIHLSVNFMKQRAVCFDIRKHTHMPIHTDIQEDYGQRTLDNA